MLPIKRIILTPNGPVFKPDEIEVSNRVLRTYKDYH